MDYTQNNQETIILPPVQKLIEANAFRGQYNLKSIVIPDSVEEIGENAFKGTGLEEIVFPRELRRLGPLGGEMPNLRKLDFSKVTKLEVIPSEFAGLDVPELKELVLPIGVKKIESSLAIDYLDTLFLPPTVEVIEDLDQSGICIYCFSPKVDRISSMRYIVDGPEDVNHLYVLPEYLETYKAQCESEDVPEDNEAMPVIEAMPEEYRHFYD